MEVRRDTDVQIVR